MTSQVGRSGSMLRLCLSLQRLRPCQRARLVAQHIEVMLEIEHMLAAAVTALVTGDQATGLPDLDVQRMDARFHPAARAGWH